MKGAFIVAYTIVFLGFSLLGCYLMKGPSWIEGVKIIIMSRIAAFLFDIRLLLIDRWEEGKENRVRDYADQVMRGIR